MRIAYINERDLNNAKVNGSMTRDFILIDLLKDNHEVDYYFCSPQKFHPYSYVLNNKHKDEALINTINSKQYDLCIISTFLTSPLLRGYSKLKHKQIYYLADSSFLMSKTAKTLGLKFFIACQIMKRREVQLLKKQKCCYLGSDEIIALPEKYQSNGYITPFFKEVKHNSFSKDGFYTFIADYNFRPNKIALHNILKIAPRLNRNIHLYGINLPNKDELGDEVPGNVIFKGFVNKVEEAFDGAYANLYPVKYGSGVKNKVIEAMSYGIPTIGFKEAFTNLNVANETNGFIIQSLDDLVGYNHKISKETSLKVIEFLDKEYSRIQAIEQIEQTLNHAL